MCRSRGGGRLTGLPKATPVVGDDPVARRDEGGDLVLPGATAQGPAVDQHDRATRAVILVVDLDGSVVLCTDRQLGHAEGVPPDRSRKHRAYGGFGDDAIRPPGSKDAVLRRPRGAEAMRPARFERATLGLEVPCSIP